MSSQLLEYINPIKILILITVLRSFKDLKWRENYLHKIVCFILIFSLATEVINSTLIYLKHPIGFSVNIYVIVCFFLWLLLILKENSKNKKLNFSLIYTFISLSIINLFFGEGYNHFNYYTFILGTVLYLMILIVSCIYKLKEEELAFFQTNECLLLFSPVIFFLGLSFLFGFGNLMNGYILIYDIKLYAFISYFVNIMYYSLINIYILLEKRKQHAL